MPRKRTENIAFGINTPLTTCKVFDSDEVLFEPEEIDYYKTCIKEFEASNRLLGEINDEGEYIISEKVRRDLALLPKEHIQSGYNLVEAYSHVLGKDLFFYIEFTEEDDKQIASLYLKEKVSGYRDVEVLTSFIAKIVQPKSDSFQDKAKRVFNIQDTLTTIDEGKFMSLVMQIQDRIDYWFELEEIMDISSQIYVLRVLSLLETEGDLGQKVIDEYNRQMKYDGLDGLNVKRRYLSLRKILDKVIEKFGGKEIVFKKNLAEIKAIKAEFSSPIKKVENIRQKQASRPVAVKKPEEKAPAKAESKPSKGGSKSAGKKGGDKKPNKKKDKKKEDKKKDEKKAGKGGGGSSKAPKTETSIPKPFSGKSGSATQQRPIDLMSNWRATPRREAPPREAPSDEEVENIFARIAGKGAGREKLGGGNPEMPVKPTSHEKAPVPTGEIPKSQPREEEMQ